MRHPQHASRRGLRRPVPRPFRPAWPGGGRTGRSAGHLPMRRSR
nr:MAG TPA: hypothetical protein [Caudoviricetes sp.]